MLDRWDKLINIECITFEVDYFEEICVLLAQSSMSIRYHNHYYFRYHTFNLKVSSIAMEMRPYTSRNG